MSNKKLATGIKLPKRARLSFCEGCIAGKMKRKTFKAVGEIRSKRKLQLDVCGPMPVDSIGGKSISSLLSMTIQDVVQYTFSKVNLKSLRNLKNLKLVYSMTAVRE